MNSKIKQSRMDEKVVNFGKKVYEKLFLRMRKKSANATLQLLTLAVFCLFLVSILYYSCDILICFKTARL